MNKLEVQSNIDPIKESFDSLIVIMFSKSTSKNYGLALSIARGANKYTESKINSSTTHIAVFAKTREDAGRALAVTEFVAGLKGTLFFTKGRVSSRSYELLPVLQCYLEATACIDYKAHCHIIMDDPDTDAPKRAGSGFSINLKLPESTPLLKKIQVDRYSFPCKYLHSWFRFQQTHPSKICNQIQAGAVARGCDICPYFDPSEYKKVGEKSVLVELFNRT